MPHDPALVAEVQAWLKKARKDLDTAAYELQANPPFTDDIVFHAQQAVEKALKAFLAWHGVPFRRTHNLVELGGECCQIEPGLESLLRRAAPLTEYAWRFRYPGDPDEATVEEASNALTIAQEVFSSISKRLPEEVRL
ncbi:MAG: HEPN domain-containing protein [Bryobacterales bacterium]|nr:HEPN domain-containing protein [Bryobacteraceae bacterium]MDW8353111.1 HEPN domain-containing protein [Bryobacterales bacterium]